MKRLKVKALNVLVLISFIFTSMPVPPVFAAHRVPSTRNTYSPAKPVTVKRDPPVTLEDRQRMTDKINAAIGQVENSEVYKNFGNEITRLTRDRSKIIREAGEAASAFILSVKAKADELQRLINTSPSGNPVSAARSALAKVASFLKNPSVYINQAKTDAGKNVDKLLYNLQRNKQNYDTWLQPIRDLLPKVESARTQNDLKAIDKKLSTYMGRALPRLVPPPAIVDANASKTRSLKEADTKFDSYIAAWIDPAREAAKAEARRKIAEVTSQINGLEREMKAARNDLDQKIRVIQDELAANNMRLADIEDQLNKAYPEVNNDRLQGEIRSFLSDWNKFRELEESLKAAYFRALEERAVGALRTKIADLNVYLTDLNQYLQDLTKGKRVTEPALHTTPFTPPSLPEDPREIQDKLLERGEELLILIREDDLRAAYLAEAREKISKTQDALNRETAKLDQASEDLKKEMHSLSIAFRSAVASLHDTLKSVETAAEDEWFIDSADLAALRQLGEFLERNKNFESQAWDDDARYLIALRDQRTGLFRDNIKILQRNLGALEAYVSDLENGGDVRPLPALEDTGTYQPQALPALPADGLRNKAKEGQELLDRRNRQISEKRTRAINRDTQRLIEVVGLDPQMSKDIKVISAEKQSWGDGCVGWGSSESICTQAIVHEFNVVLELYHLRAEFHAGILNPETDMALLAVRQAVADRRADLRSVELGGTQFLPRGALPEIPEIWLNSPYHWLPSPFKILSNETPDETTLDSVRNTARLYFKSVQVGNDSQEAELIIDLGPDRRLGTGDDLILSGAVGILSAHDGAFISTELDYARFRTEGIVTISQSPCGFEGCHLNYREEIHKGIDGRFHSNDDQVRVAKYFADNQESWRLEFDYSEAGVVQMTSKDMQRGGRVMSKVRLDAAKFKLVYPGFEVGPDGVRSMEIFEYNQAGAVTSRRLWEFENFVIDDQGRAVSIVKRTDSATGITQITKTFLSDGRVEYSTEQRMSDGSVRIQSGLSRDFDLTSTTVFSIRVSEGDVNKIIENLTSSFTATDRTIYSAAVRREDMVLIASHLNSDFTDNWNASYSVVRRLGIDTIGIAFNLDFSFGDVVGRSIYMIQRNLGNGEIGIASNVSRDFTAEAYTNYSSQRFLSDGTIQIRYPLDENFNSTRDTQYMTQRTVVDVTYLAVNLSNTFGDVPGMSHYSTQRYDHDGRVVFISNNLSNFFGHIEGTSRYLSQTQLQNGFVGIAYPLTTAFTATSTTRYFTQGYSDDGLIPVGRNLTADFHDRPGVSTYLRMRLRSDGARELITNLNTEFEVTALTEYSTRERLPDGRIRVTSGLDSNFDETPNTRVSIVDPDPELDGWNISISKVVAQLEIMQFSILDLLDTEGLTSALSVTLKDVLQNNRVLDTWLIDKGKDQQSFTDDDFVISPEEKRGPKYRAHLRLQRDSNRYADYLVDPNTRRAVFERESTDGFLRPLNRQAASARPASPAPMEIAMPLPASPSNPAGKPPGFPVVISDPVDELRHGSHHFEVNIQNLADNEEAFVIVERTLDPVYRQEMRMVRTPGSDLYTADLTGFPAGTFWYRIQTRNPNDTGRNKSTQEYQLIVEEASSNSGAVIPGTPGVFPQPVSAPVPAENPLSTLTSVPANNAALEAAAQAASQNVLAVPVMAGPTSVAPAPAAPQPAARDSRSAAFRLQTFKTVQEAIASQFGVKPEEVRVYATRSERSSGAFSVYRLNYLVSRKDPVTGKIYQHHYEQKIAKMNSSRKYTFQPTAGLSYESSFQQGGVPIPDELKGQIAYQTGIAFEKIKRVAARSVSGTANRQVYRVTYHYEKGSKIVVGTMEILYEKWNNRTGEWRYARAEAKPSSSASSPQASAPIAALLPGTQPSPAVGSNSADNALSTLTSAPANAAGAASVDSTLADPVALADTANAAKPAAVSRGPFLLQALTDQMKDKVNKAINSIRESEDYQKPRIELRNLKRDRSRLIIEAGKRASDFRQSFRRRYGESRLMFKILEFRKLLPDNLKRDAKAALSQAEPLFLKDLIHYPDQAEYDAKTNLNNLQKNLETNIQRWNNWLKPIEDLLPKILEAKTTKELDAIGRSLSIYMKRKPPVMLSAPVPIDHNASKTKKIREANVALDNFLAECDGLELYKQLSLEDKLLLALQLGHESYYDSPAIFSDIKTEFSNCDESGKNLENCQGKITYNVGRLYEGTIQVVDGKLVLTEFHYLNLRMKP